MNPLWHILDDKYDKIELESPPFNRFLALVASIFNIREMEKNLSENLESNKLKIKSTKAV